MTLSWQICIALIVFCTSVWNAKAGFTLQQALHSLNDVNVVRNYDDSMVPTMKEGKLETYIMKGCTFNVCDMIGNDDFQPNPEYINEMLYLAMKYEKYDIANFIVQNSKFQLASNTGMVLDMAIIRSLHVVVYIVMKKPNFIRNTDENMFDLDETQQLVIDSLNYRLGLALQYRNENATLFILKHPRYKPNGEFVSFLETAIQSGLDRAFKIMVNNVNFKPTAEIMSRLIDFAEAQFKYDLRSFLFQHSKYILDDKFHAFLYDIAKNNLSKQLSSILDKEGWHPDETCFKRLLELTLTWGRSATALAIVKHPKFALPSNNQSYMLKAMKIGFGAVVTEFLTKEKRELQTDYFDTLLNYSLQNCSPIITMILVEHPKFVASNRFVSFIELAIRKLHQFAIPKMIDLEALKKEDSIFDKLLAISLERAVDAVVIVQHRKFKPTARYPEFLAEFARLGLICTVLAMLDLKYQLDNAYLTQLLQVAKTDQREAIKNKLKEKFNVLDGDDSVQHCCCF